MSSKGNYETDMRGVTPVSPASNIDQILAELGKSVKNMEPIGRDTMFKEVDSFKDYNISTDRCTQSR